MIKQATKTRLPKRIGRLDELAHNMWWSWHVKARQLFRADEVAKYIDPAECQLSYNPLLMALLSELTGHAQDPFAVASAGNALQDPP